MTLPNFSFYSPLQPSQTTCETQFSLWIHHPILSISLTNIASTPAWPAPLHSAATSSFFTTTKPAVAIQVPSVLPYDLPSQLTLLLIPELTCSKVHADSRFWTGRMHMVGSLSKNKAALPLVRENWQLSFLPHHALSTWQKQLQLFRLAFTLLLLAT